MLKPLTKEQTDSILRAAAGAFANKGYAHTSVRDIAKSAGVSVGVIYKYYKDKGDLFNSCVIKSLDTLDQVFEAVQSKGRFIMEMAEELITSTQSFARTDPEYFRLYHQITVSGSSLMTPEIAELIEGRTAKLYTGLMQNASETGEIRQDMDPAMIAFLFDNLLMMLHFSYTCGYYENRFKIFCGEDIGSRDEFVKEQLLKFIGGALNGLHTGL
ncbi:MAG: TetR/AcrR family transcriptional regulator [Firmicutes bacterium]|nr:TetR/AcrR family transcriptional regulator [Bacillota bacterium]